jgi:hypothetical protein
MKKFNKTNNYYKLRNIFYNNIFIFSNALILTLIIIFTTNSINEIKISRIFFPNIPTANKEITNILQTEFMAESYEGEYHQLEVYDENFKLLRYIPPNSKNISNRKIINQIESNKKIQEIFLTHNLGHAICKDSGTEIDFYFMWNIDNNNQNILTVYYEIRKSKLLVEYVPYLCYIILIINFFIFSRIKKSSI